MERQQLMTSLYRWVWGGHLIKWIYHNQGISTESYETSGTIHEEEEEEEEEEHHKFLTEDDSSTGW